MSTNKKGTYVLMAMQELKIKKKIQISDTSFTLLFSGETARHRAPLRKRKLMSDSYPVTEKQLNQGEKLRIKKEIKARFLSLVSRYIVKKKNTGVRLLINANKRRALNTDFSCVKSQERAPM